MMPAISLGFSVEHMSFSGTISLKAGTMTRVISEVSECLIYHGFRKIIYVNGHGGNTGILQITMQSLRRKHEAVFCLTNIWELARDEFRRIRKSRNGDAGHADEFETSLLLAIDASRVKLEKMKKIKRSGRLPKTQWIDPFATHVARFAWKTEDYSKSGVIGDPRGASLSEGERLLKGAVDNLVRLIREMEAQPSAR